MIPWRKWIAGVTGADPKAAAVVSRQVTIIEPFDGYLKGEAPFLRFEETDQTDPVGRYLLYVDGGDFHLAKSLSADFASYAPIIKHLATGKATYLMSPIDDGRSFIFGSTDQYGGYIVLHGKSYGTNPGDILFYTPNAAQDANTLRFKVDGTTNATTVYCYGNLVTNKLYGDDASDLIIFGNATLTHDTERGIQIRVLDKGNNLWPACITITPNGASPTMNFNSRTISNAKLNTPDISGAVTAASTLTMPAFTLGDAITGATKNITGVATMEADAYEVGGTAGVNFDGAVTNLTVVNGIVTAAS